LEKKQDKDCIIPATFAATAQPGIKNVQLFLIAFVVNFYTDFITAFSYCKAIFDK